MSRSSFSAFGLSMSDHEQILVAATEATAAENNDESEAEDGEAKPSVSISSQASSSSSLFGRMLGLKSDDGGMYYTFNRLMKQYVQWLDSNPILARCVTSALTGCVGAILSSRKPVIKSNNIHRRRHGPSSSSSSNNNNNNKNMEIDWLEVLSFGLHGALVAGPLSYRM